MKKRQFFIVNNKKISRDIDRKHQIIDYDKLYHKLLLEIGYEGNFGDILKQNPKEINNLDKIWELHKLRNKLVHDFDLLDQTTLIKKAKEYNREFERLLDKVS